MTGRDVTECTGGADPVTERDLAVPLPHPLRPAPQPRPRRWSWRSWSPTSWPRDARRPRRPDLPSSRPCVHLQHPRRARPQQVARGAAAVEPGAPALVREHRDLAMMIGRDVRTGLGGQHGEGLARPRVVRHRPAMQNQSRPAHREQPPVLALVGARRLGRGEFVEAVGDDQAAAALVEIGELAPVGAEIVDRLAARPGPAPAPLDELGRAVAGVPAQDRRPVGDPVSPRAAPTLGMPFGEAQGNAAAARTPRRSRPARPCCCRGCTWRRLLGGRARLRQLDSASRSPDMRRFASATAPSSSGLGRRPLTAKTRVRVP